MFSAAAPKCTKCKKTVGFAEAVYHNEHVYHRDCYRCNSCSKKLQRGQGLSHDGENYCHHCHAKLFGPNGFRPGVNRTEQTIARVKMQMQPPFAHVSVDLKKSGMIKAVNSIRKSLSGKAPSKLHQFDVAVFTGKTEKDLEAYLKEGKVDTSKWEAGMVADLLEQLKLGKSELGLDTNGNALRVASVVKVLVYDEENDVMLFAPLNSAEDSVQSTHDKTKVTEAEVYDLAFGDLNQNAYPQVLEMMNFHLDHVPLPIHDFVYPGVYEDLGFNNMAASGLETKTVKQGKVEIPGALVLESTFATLQETPAQAGARLLTGRFSMKHATPKIFSRTVHKKVKTHLSTRFTGLNSEYHIFYIFLKKTLIAPLQKSLPREKVTPIKLPSPTKTGMNTNWYVWLHRGHLKSAEIVSELEKIYKSDPRVKTLVGDVNFKGELALAMGEVMLEELQALQFFDK